MDNGSFNTMDKEDIKISFLLDLFNASYNRAYLSVSYLQSSQNIFYNRIEMFLPEVGRLCLYQKFIENDQGEQIPHFTVFYTSADKENIRTMIKSSSLLGKAIGIVYKSKMFFNQNPQYKISNEKDIVKRLKQNEIFMKKIYKKHMLNRRHNWFDNFYEK